MKVSGIRLTKSKGNPNKREEVICRMEMISSRDGKMPPVPRQPVNARRAAALKARRLTAQSQR